MEIDTSINSSFERLGCCEVCAAENAKYTCPKCEVKTCSLKCVNIHKKELFCDGIRDPTKFITLDKFTSVDLLNDYRMLEQVGRVVEGLHKNKIPNEYRAGRKILPKHLHKLKTTIQERKTTIHFLPKNFERRIKNRTYLHRHKKQIYWNIEWVFPQADDIKILEHGCCEESKLCAVLHKFLNGQIDEHQNEKLSFYQAAGASNVICLLKAENVAGDKFYELDSGVSIRDNLVRKTIVEFPTIYVVLKGHDIMYNMIESECEEEILGPSVQKCKIENEGNVVLAQLLNEAAKEETIKSKNLLFITEYSDAELSSDDDNT